MTTATWTCPFCKGTGETYDAGDAGSGRAYCTCPAGRTLKGVDLTKELAVANRRVRVGVAVILRRGKFVLMGFRIGSHGANTWSFPGGHIEPGEQVVQAAARELEEETGISMHPLWFSKLTFTNDVFEAEGKHYVTLYVEATIRGLEEPRVMEPNKCKAWGWFEAPPSPLFLPVENLLKEGFPVWAK